jgi:hypothetical protein
VLLKPVLKSELKLVLVLELESVVRHLYFLPVA